MKYDWRKDWSGWYAAYAFGFHFFRHVRGPIGKYLEIYDLEKKAWRKCLNFGSYNYLGIELSKRTDTMPWKEELLSEPFTAASPEALGEFRKKIAEFTGKAFAAVTTTGF